MISGNGHAPDPEQFYESRIGADDFIKEPFSRLEVFSRVEVLLDVDMVPRRKDWLPTVSSSSRPLADATVAEPAAPLRRHMPLHMGQTKRLSRRHRRE